MEKVEVSFMFQGNTKEDFMSIEKFDDQGRPFAAIRQ